MTASVSSAVFLSNYDFTGTRDPIPILFSGCIQNKMIITTLPKTTNQMLAFAQYCTYIYQCFMINID